MMKGIYGARAEVLFSRTIRSLVKKGAYFITASNCSSDDLENYVGVPRNRIRTVYLGVDEAFYAGHDENRAISVRARYGLPKDFFLFIGAMNRRKNLKSLLSSFNLFKKKYGRPTKLVIAGRFDWGGDELRSAISLENINESVVSVGYIPDVDLPVVLASATALVYPSLYEGFGFPPLEAMACGTPVIASNTGAIPETTAGHALLLDPYDVEGFAEAMEQISADTPLRSNLSSSGKKWVRNFSWDRTVTETLSVYDQLLEG
jgi:glycosyltransferase involved in cell wall biosynthesis